MLSFLDDYSGYNQIRMDPLDEEKMTFITADANFCYRVMPFGLKNIGTTYQRLMDRVFKQQIRLNIEVYMDDMVVKSQSIPQHVADLEEVFRELRKYDMHLNPKKCTFGVGGGKFLNFMITHRGIEAKPDKCTVILEMRNPANIQEVQNLNSRLATLSRFLLKLLEKEKPFYKLLKITEPFLWDETCEQAFLAFKTIATPLILSRPRPKAPLLLYLSVADESVSSALTQEEGKHQLPIYFTSRILHNVEKRYQIIEKVVLALTTSAPQLRPYFQSHQVVVKTNYLIKQVLRKLELAGRITAWPIELSELNIHYEPRGPMKTQFMEDFLAEFDGNDTTTPYW